MAMSTMMPVSPAEQILRDATGQPATPDGAPPPATLKTALRNLIQTEHFTSVDREKFEEYKRISRNDLYYRGVQNIALGPTSRGVDYVPVAGGGLSAANRDTQTPSFYDYVANIYQGDLRKLTAVVGGRSPNVKASPIIKGKEEYIAHSRLADQVAGYLHDILTIDGWHRYLVLSLGKNGVTYAYTPTVADKDKYGTTEEPKIEVTEEPFGEPTLKCPYCQTAALLPEGHPGVGPVDCPMCGEMLDESAIEPPPMVPVPRQTGTRQYTNANPELHLYSGAFVTTKYNIRSLAETPFLRLEFGQDPGYLLGRYPGMRKILGASMLSAYSAASTSISSMQGRDVRSTIGSYTGTARYGDTPEALYSCFWLRPWVYEWIEPGNEHSEVREYFKQNFRYGAKIPFINSEPCVDEQGNPIIEHESLDEVWTACRSDEGETLHTAPWMESMIQLQDVYNDIINILVFLLERQASITFVNPDVIDVDVLAKRRHQPYSFFPAKAGTGGSDMRNHFYTATAANPEAKSLQIGKMLVEEYREMTGILPPIFGAAGEDENTARQAELRRNQALMMLGTLWNNIRDFWAATYENLVLQCAQYSVGGVIYRPRHGLRPPMPLELGDLSVLLKGTWTFHAQEGMPMSSGQRYDAVMKMIDQATQSPVAAAIYKLDHPAQAANIQDAIGITGWEWPDTEEREALLDVINELLQMPPVPGSDPMTGQPTLRPAIEPDTVMFNPPFAFQTAREWLLKNRSMQQQNPEGFQHVLLYTRAWKDIVEPPMPPPGMGPEGMEGGAGGTGGEMEINVPGEESSQLTAPPVNPGAIPPGAEQPFGGPLMDATTVQ